LFGGTLINCMGMANENTFNRTMSSVSRCSDDFQPENRGWFAHHITQCTYNSLVTGQYFYSDFDMWWSGDSQAVKNSVLRAVSGGPIYVSDRIDQSDAEIFKPLTLSDGRILRCDELAVPTEDWLCSDPTTGDDNRAYTVFNVCSYKRGKTSVRCAVMAAYNLFSDGRPTDGKLDLSVLPDSIFEKNAEKYLVFDYFDNNVSVIKKDDIIDFRLENRDALKLYIIIPADEKTVPLGLCGKYIAPATIASVDLGINGSGTIRLREGGNCMIYSENELEFVSEKSGELRFEKNGALYTVFTGEESVLEIKVHEC